MINISSLTLTLSLSLSSNKENRTILLFKPANIYVYLSPFSLYVTTSSEYNVPRSEVCVLMK